jgi:hypothetical protein
MVPKTPDADCNVIRQWKSIENPSWMHSKTIKDKFMENSIVEFASGSSGPIVIGLLHLKLWRFAVHPEKGLVNLAENESSCLYCMCLMV